MAPRGEKTGSTVELSDLTIFKTVVEEGGVVKASQRLNRVPSNVTTRIKQLEQSVGVDLFLRQGRRLVLSSNGEALLEYADRLLRLVSEARSAVAGDVPRGALRLGALESTSASRLPMLLADFHRRFPDVRIELRTGTNDALTAAVKEGRLDVAFVAELPKDATLAGLPIYQERLTLITPADHVPVRNIKDLRGLSVIAFPNGCAYRRRLERWLGPRALPTVRVLELGSYHAIVACVAAGSGVALVPESVLSVMKVEQVRRHDLPAVIANVKTPFIWRRDDIPAPALAMRGLIQQLAQTRAAGTRMGADKAPV
jgi:DNA-binding transcriptional LysR family regulator